uniref:Uncharacterized protein n=1 Tax=Megaselia scalaris TaxID=36166 RepID=T1GNG8_MEGSC
MDIERKTSKEMNRKDEINLCHREMENFIGYYTRKGTESAEKRAVLGNRNQGNFLCNAAKNFPTRNEERVEKN